MKVKVFQSNHNGKIEFTRAELEKLLNEVYTDGYNEGKSSHWTWTSPYVGNLNDITLTNAADSSANYTADKKTALNNTNTADKTTVNPKTADANPVYTVKVNGTDISKLVNDIFGTRTSNNVPENVVDAFDKLAKELSF